MKEGFHLMIDAFGCNADKLNDEQLIYDFLKEMPAKVGMRVIDGPFVKQHSFEIKEESGPTGVVVLAESHSSIHAYPYREYMAFDLFSCKRFNISSVIAEIKEAFNPQEISESFIPRGFCISNKFSEEQYSELEGV